MSRPDLSVVVCTHNRAEMLRAALSSLLNLNTGDRFSYEILVVDNASDDATPEIVYELDAAVQEKTATALRRVYEPKKGVVHARNCGIREARGEWIAYFDDDQEADADWLLKLYETAETKQARCVGGAVRLKLPPGGRLSPVCRMLLGESVGMDELRRYSRTVTPGCGNLMIHKSVFEQIGRFDPAYKQRGEDTDLFLRMLSAGIDAWYTPEAVIHHLISEDRLRDGHFEFLSRNMGEGIAEKDREIYGRWKFPLMYAARVGQAALVIWPRWLWMWIRRNHEEARGRRYRLMISRGYIARGARLLCPTCEPRRDDSHRTLNDSGMHKLEGQT